MCDHAHVFESKNFDEAKAEHQKLIQLLEAIIQNSKNRMAEIDQIDRTVFPDLKAYDTYQEAEKVRNETRAKITKQVDELVDRIRKVWPNFSQKPSSMVFNGSDVFPWNLEKLTQEMRDYALAHNSTTYVKKFTEDFCQQYR